MDIPYTVSARPDTGLFNAKIGIWLFLASEVMLFGGLFSSYIFLRVGADYAWPIHELDVWPGFVNTLVLIGSSVTVVMAWASLKLRKIGMYKVYMTITVICAGIFMGLKAYEYSKKFKHYAVKLTDGTILTGHLPHGYEIEFGEITELSMTITGENKAVSAAPLSHVLPFVEGEIPTFTTAEGEELTLDEAGWSAFHAQIIDAAEVKLANDKAALVAAGRGAEADLKYLLPDTSVTLKPATPLKVRVKPSKLYGYTGDTITFRDGTIASGKLINDRMTLEVDGVDARSVPDAEKSLAWKPEYLGDEWKEEFVHTRDSALTHFANEYPSRDPSKSATLQKKAFYLHIHSPTPEGHAADGDAHSAEAKAPSEGHGGDAHAGGHGHYPEVILEKKDITFFSNYTPKLNTFYAIYFTLTGLHGLHVVAGALVLLYFLVCNGKMLREDPEHLANRVEVGGLFWHFVDLVWIFLFPLLYLL